MLIGYNGTVRVGNMDINIEKASLLLIPPNVPHSLQGLNKIDESSQRHLLWLDKDWLTSMLTHCSEMHKLSELFLKALGGMYFCQETALGAYQVIRTLDYGTSSLEQLAVLLRCLSVLATSKTAVTLSAPTQCTGDIFECEQDKVDRIAKFVDENYAKNITLGCVAECIYCSPRTANRIFKHHFGESFSQRLKKIRLSQAAHLLETTHLSISYICQCVGYNNQSNFNRLFKSYKGISPREYRSKFSR